MSFISVEMKVLIKPRCFPAWRILPLLSALLVLALPLEAMARSDALVQALKGLDEVGVLGSLLSYTVPGHAPVIASNGYVDMGKSAPMDVDRLFQIGSQTKMFTSAALLVLQKEGKLKLDDLVSKYVVGTPRPEQLTIRQLVMHTGGIGDSITFFDPPAGRRPDFDVSFANHLFLGKVAGEEFAPGEQWNYNNLGFVILGQVIESASGQSLNDYTRSRLLKPLGMHETFLGNLDAYPESRMARGYFPQDGQQVDTTMPDLSWASSAGDMVSSMADMRLWAKVLLNTNNPTGLKLDDFRETVSDVSETGGFARYGLGMMERRLGGKKLWGHGGFIHGYVTLTLVEPETGIILQLMFNLADESERVLETAEKACAVALKLAEAQLYSGD